MKPVIFYQPTTQTHLYNHLHFQSIGLFILIQRDKYFHFKNIIHFITHHQQWDYPLKDSTWYLTNSGLKIWIINECKRKWYFSFSTFPAFIIHIIHSHWILIKILAYGWNSSISSTRKRQAPRNYQNIYKRILSKF